MAAGRLTLRSPNPAWELDLVVRLGQDRTHSNEDQTIASRGSHPNNGSSERASSSISTRNEPLLISYNPTLNFLAMNIQNPARNSYIACAVATPPASQGRNQIRAELNA